MHTRFLAASVLFALAASCAGGGFTGDGEQNVRDRSDTDDGPSTRDTDLDTRDRRPVDSSNDTAIPDARDSSEGETSPPLDGSDDADATRDADLGPCGGCGPGAVCTEGGCFDVCAETQSECGEVEYEGDVVDCGGCSGENVCAQNECRSICYQSGADCGDVFWGGKSANCGSCAAGDCFQNRCVAAGYRSIDGGYRHTCATDDTGAVYCWGADTEEQLGNGSDGASKTPVSVSTNGSAIEVRSDNLHTCARLESGELDCWGLNNKGQIGDGSADSLVDAPRLVDGLSAATDPGVGALHSCAALPGGGVQCWGYELFGRLGNGEDRDRARRTPVDVQNLGSAVEVVAGGSHSCALESDGSVWCWGNGSLGRLGNGRFSGSSTPVEVSNLEHAVDLAAGTDHTCAVARDGSAWCWGRGGDYQLGNGSSGNRAVPVRVQGLDDAVAVAAGAAHSCARTLEGRVYCWGSNASYDGSGDRTSGGQLGDGTFQDSKDPVSVVGPDGSGELSDVVDLRAGRRHTCAVTADGSAYCWGGNTGGQLGDGGTDDQHTPIEVP